MKVLVRGEHMMTMAHKHTRDMRKDIALLLASTISCIVFDPIAEVGFRMLLDD